MIKKIRKGQILKNILLNDSFFNDESYFLPIRVNRVLAAEFNVKYAFASILPAILYTNSQEEAGNSAKLSPMFMNLPLENKNFFNENNVEEESSINNLFKKIYSKNVVSSFGNNDYIEDISTIDYIYRLDDIDVDITIKLDKSKILNNIEEGQRFYVHVYLLNDFYEVIDNLNIESERQIESYYDNETDESLLFQDAAIEFINNFSLVFRRYNFPIRENLENNLTIRGFTHFPNSITEENFNSDFLKEITVSLVSEEIQKSFSIKKFTQFSTPDAESFAFNMINRQNVFNFIKSIYLIYNTSDIENVSVPCILNFSIKDRLSRESTIEKNINIAFSQISRFYNDMLRYKIEKNLENKSIAFLQLENLSQEFREGQSRTRNYRINFSISQECLQNIEIKNSKVRFEFFNTNLEKIEVNRLYFDDNLTENNYVDIEEGSLSISNILNDRSQIQLYFRNYNEYSILESYIVFYYNLDTIPIMIGPFRTSESFNNLVSSYNRISENNFDEASLILGESTFFQTSNIDDIKNVMLNRQSNLDILKINTSRIVENIYFKNLNHFNLQENTNILNQISLLINNVIVKVRKKIFVNDLEIFNTKKCCIFSDIVSKIENINDTYFINCNIKSFPDISQNLDLEARLINNNNILRNINSFLLGEDVINRNFKIQLSIELSYIVLPNDTVNHFGKNISEQSVNYQDVNASKNNLVDFVIENNSNFSITRLREVINNIYSESYFNPVNKNNYLNEVYNISDENVYDAIKSIEINQDEINTVNNSTVIDTTSIDETSGQVDRESNESSQDLLLNLENIEYLDFVKNTNITTLDNIKIDLRDRVLEINKISKDFPLVKIQGELAREILNKRRLGIIDFTKITITPVVTYNGIFSKVSSSSVNGDFNVVAKDKEIFIFNDIKDSLVLRFNIDNEEEISLDALQNNYLFEEFDEEYYSIISTILNENDDEIDKVVIENIYFRLNIDFNVGERRIIISKNLNIKHSPNFSKYIIKNAVRFDQDKINLDVAKTESKHYMPRIIFNNNDANVLNTTSNMSSINSPSRLDLTDVRSRISRANFGR